MVQTLFEKTADWLAGEGPRQEVVLNSQIRLARNLMGFPFPARFTHADSEAVEQHVVGALERLGLLESGAYLSMQDLSVREARVLAERQLAPRELTQGSHARGVYVSSDQSLSIVVNGADHIAIHALAAGLQLDEAWRRVDELDTTLLEELPAAFNDRLGFLTSSLSQTGTGLKASVALHLPALIAANDPLGRELTSANAYAGLFGQRYVADRLFNSQSDFFQLTNWSSLGQSEEEIIFRLHHAATELAGCEQALRETMKNDSRQLEDRVSRALGLARNARLLEYGEAVALLSSVRLGAATRIAEDPLHDVDELLIASQSAHLELRAGRDCDEITLNSARADLFRSRFRRGRR